MCTLFRVFAQSAPGENAPPLVGQQAEPAEPAEDSLILDSEPAPATDINESDLSFTFSDDTAPDNAPLQVFGFGDFLRMVLVLTLVVGLIYALYFFLRRSKKTLEDESNFITLLTSQTLPGGKQLHIIDVAGQVYLLGSGEAGLSLITEITDKPSIDALRLQVGSQQSSHKSFSQLMSSFFIKTAGKESAEQAEQVSGLGFDFLHQQRKKLRKL